MIILRRRAGVWLTMPDNKEYITRDETGNINISNVIAIALEAMAGVEE